jgi:hypothetical protein
VEPQTHQRGTSVSIAPVTVLFRAMNKLPNNKPRLKSKLSVRIQARLCINTAFLLTIRHISAELYHYPRIVFTFAMTCWALIIQQEVSRLLHGLI